MLIYLAAIAGGVWIRLHYPGNIVYNCYKDLIPLILAIPAAWLGFCFQRRSSYLQQLRTLWSQIVANVQEAIQYTHLTAPTQADYGRTLVKLFGTVDEVRGVFRNIGENDGNIGLYPFESLKGIRDAISRLGYGDQIDPKAAAAARLEIVRLWHRVRDAMLKEFDRDYPSYPDSYYLDAVRGKPGHPALAGGDHRANGQADSHSGDA